MCEKHTAENPFRAAVSSLRTHGVECFTLAWTVGLLSAFLGKGAYSAAASVLLLVAAVVPVLFFREERPRAVLCTLSAGLALGICVWQQYDLRVRQPMLALDGQTVTLTGTVTETEPAADGGFRCMLRTRLNGHRAEVEWFTGDIPPYAAGDTVTLRAELTRITADYRSRTASYEAASGRYLRIYRAELLDEKAYTGFSLRRLTARYRDRLTERIRMALPEEEAGLLCAMLFGDKTALAEPEKLALYRSGIGHITAVSGLHLVFFCTAVAWLLRLLQCSPRGVLAGCLAAIVLFSMIADSAVSVYRAGVMLAISLAAPVFHRQADTLRSLCIAVLLCTAFTPYVIGSAAFWLSVSGVFGIGIAAPYMTQNLQPGFGKTLAQLCCVAAAVFPASLLLTGESSLLAPVCNLLILPFSIAALYLGLIFACTGGLAAFLLPAAGLLCRMTAVLAETASALPFSHVFFQSRAVSVVTVLFVPVLLLLFAAKCRPVQITAAFLTAGVLLAGLSAWAARRAERQLRVAVLGQKQEAVLAVSSRGQTVIADLSGAVKNPQYVQRYLREQGITHCTLLLSGSRNLAAYQRAFPAGTVSALYLADDSPLREGQTVCGVVPQCSTGIYTAAVGDARLTTDGAAAEITCYGQKIAVLPAKDTAPQTAFAVIRWGRAGAVPEDSAAIRLLTGETGNNCLLTVPPDGSAAVQYLS